MWKDYSGKGSSYIISFLRDLTVKLDNIEIYRETQGSISRSELRIKNFSGGYSIGSVLRIDFKPGVRASFEEVFINYKNVLCWNKKNLVNLKKSVELDFYLVQQYLFDRKQHVVKEEQASLDNIHNESPWKVKYLLLPLMRPPNDLKLCKKYSWVKNRPSLNLEFFWNWFSFLIG